MRAGATAAAAERKEVRQADMPRMNRRFWLFAALSASLSAAACANGEAAELGFEGAWLISDLAAFEAGGEDKHLSSPVPIKDERRVIQIDRSNAAGKTTTEIPDLTPELGVLGYKGQVPGFDGNLEGNAAFGTRAECWGAGPACRLNAGFRFRSERQLEFIYAWPWATGEQCPSSLDSIAALDHILRFVYTLEPPYIVREVRFLDQPDDGSPSSLITSVTSADQKFRVEVDFELPPPAPVYVDLGRRSDKRLVVVRGPGAADVFRSDVLTLEGLQLSPAARRTWT